MSPPDLARSSRLHSPADDETVVVMSEDRLTTEAYLGGPVTVSPQELVYGLMRDAPAPTPRHQDTVGITYRQLQTYVEYTGIGKAWISPIDVILDRDRALVVQPDVIAIMRDRLHIVSDRVWGAPDLIVEVLSPLPRIGRLSERVEWFAQYGVRECWVVHQLSTHVDVIAFGEGRVQATRVFQGEDPIASDLLPGLAVTPRLLVEGY
jgi:Uma2 family endonuclease